MVGDNFKAHAIAKITSPHLTDILPRERLYDLFRKGKDRPVKWVQGPPGSGKTTLVAEYLKSCKEKYSWYQIDEKDSDFSSFFSHLNSIAEKSSNKKRKQPPQLAPEHNKDISAFAREYFQAFYTAFTPPFTLVFDNYQVQPSDSELHEIIRIGIEEIPPGGMIIFLSRRQLYPAFKRLQANNLIEIISWDQIRLTQTELNDIVFLKHKEKFSEEMLQYVYSKTQGWVAGLILILERLQTNSPDRIAPEGLSFEDIFDYFSYEVLKKTNKQVRDFLLKCAYLKKMTLKMANSLSDSNDAESVFSNFCLNHMFIEKEFHTEFIYQFHPLFSDFLTSQASKTLSKTDLRKTKKKAAEILLDAGDLANAINLIIEIKDWHWFETVVIENARCQIMRGNNQRLIKWIGQFPEESLYASSWLLYWLGVSQIAFDPQESQDCFEIAFSLFRKNKDISGIFLSWAGIINANIFKLISGDSFLKWIPIIYDLMAEFPQFPSENIESEVLNSLLTGLVLIGTDHKQIENRATRLLELTNKSDDSLIEKKGIYLLSLHYTAKGYIHRSEILLESIRDVRNKQDNHLINNIFERHLEVLNHFYCGRNQNCIDLVFDESRIKGFHSIHFWEIPLLGHATAASLSEDQTDKANEYLQIMKSKVITGQNLDTFYYHILYAWSLLGTDLFFALHLAQNALNLATGFGFSFLIHAAQIAVSTILFELGQDDKAIEYLGEANQIAAKMRSQLAEYKCKITEAYFSFKKGDETHTAELLETAMNIGKKQDVINFIFWRSPVMSQLCSKALEHGIEEEYVKSLIKKRNLTLNACTHNIENWPWKIRIHTLGRFGVIVDDTPLSFSGKVQKAPLTMLKILISLGCSDVNEDRICDILWPDSSGDASHRALITTVQRLRRLIGYKEAIIFTEGKLSLNPYYCWVDVWSLKNLLQSNQDLWKNPEQEGQIDKITQLTETLFEKYKNPFLPSDLECHWTFNLRDNLQAQILQVITRLANFWEEQEDWKKVLDFCQKGLEINDTSEVFFQKQMTCYQHLGCRAEAITTFDRCNKNLTCKLGIEPSFQTKALLDSILKNTNPDRGL